LHLALTHPYDAFRVFHDRSEGVMRLRVRGKHVAFGLVAVSGVAFLGGLCYVLSPDARRTLVGPLEWVGADGWLAALAADPDKDVRAAATDALIRRGAPAVPALVRRVNRPGVEDRTFALAVLARMGPAARDAMPSLKPLLREDPDAEIRAHAVLAFALVGRGDPGVTAELVRMLKSPVERDREGAAFACRMLGADAKRAIPALIDSLRDPEPEVREEALQALNAITGSLGDDDAALRDPARAAAAKAMAELKTDAPAGQP
jgi:HEAT repeat protein